MTLGRCLCLKAGRLRPLGTASLVVAVMLSGNGCSTGDSATRRAVQQDTQAYRCAGFNPVADEIEYPVDVERASKRLQNDPSCRNASTSDAMPTK